MAKKFPPKDSKKVYQLSISQLFNDLETSSQGLSEDQFLAKQAAFGKNELEEKNEHRIWQIALDQFKSVLIWILLLAAIFSLIVGEKIDALAIFAIVFLNAIFGFIQEYKAERALDELKKNDTLEVRVLRHNQEKTINAKDLVPGDIILLFEGDQVPADCRLIEAFNLEVDESFLTGESLAVFKEAKTLKKDLVLAERSNMLFSSCMIVRGRAQALVTAIGMQTQIGQLAQVIQDSAEEITPLQKALDALSHRLALIASLFVLPVVVMSYFLDHQDLWHSLILAISLAVSSIPEGLPIVVTIALALGVKRMLRVQVLTKKLAAVESLGGVDVICSDKTGTITRNEMRVHSLFLPQYGFFNFPKNLSLIKVNQELNKKFDYKNASKREKEILSLMRSAVLCSDAREDFGDPTELALVSLFRAYRGDSDKLRSYQRIEEIPFSSEAKFMAVAVKHDNSIRAIIKGAPEVVFNFTSMSKKDIARLQKINHNFAERGFRVLALAEKKLSKETKKGQALRKIEQYQFLGLVALHDPPREGVKEAIRACQQAGIKVLMVTGDQQGTALAIAQQVGLKVEKVITGRELDQLTVNELNKVIGNYQVFARVSPQNKVQILEALQKLGLQVAMTGDGVNDAPALKKAAVGVAVGSGTDLSKSVADIVILDDDFSNIVAGVEEGRHIFYNIKKFVRFMLSANFDEIFCIMASILLGLPLVFLPIHILWINLVTDSFPALALSTDRAEADIMRRKPYNSKKAIMSNVIGGAISAGFLGFILTFGTFLLTLFFWQRSVNYAQTMSLTVMVSFELFLIYSVRHDNSSLQDGLFANTWLNLAVLLVATLQLLAIYNPHLQLFLQTTALDLPDLVLSVLIGSFAFWVLELQKLLAKNGAKNRL